jgi:hypothetical protein
VRSASLVIAALLLAVGLAGCAARSGETDAATDAPDSGEFCAALVAQLVAGGFDECSMPCITDIPCPGLLQCAVPGGCYTRARCAGAGGFVQVSMSGVVCDAGAASFDAGGVHSCEAAFAAVGERPVCNEASCDAGACDGFIQCWGCRYLLSCDLAGHLSIRPTEPHCDGGPDPMDGGVDAL